MTLPDTVLVALARIGAAIAALALSPVASALAPDLNISQLYHAAWTVSDGAPPDAQALVQTRDGYLWIASAAGLYKFDGIRFQRVEKVGRGRLQSDQIYSLYAPATGGVWVGYQLGGASLVKDDKITNYAEADGLPTGTLEGFAQDHSGSVWAATSRGLFRLDGGGWLDVTDSMHLPSRYVRNINVDRDGTLWIVCDQSVMFLRPGAGLFQSSGFEMENSRYSLVLSSRKEIWFAAEEGRTVQASVTDGALRTRVVAIETGNAAALIDRDGVVWGGPEEGIRRYRLDDPDRSDLRHETFTVRDGLSGRWPTAGLEDREGNIWIATTGGLDMFRESRLKLGARSTGRYVAIAPGERGNVWVTANRSQKERLLYSVANGLTEHLEPGPHDITCAYRDADGIVWFGGAEAIWQSRGNSWVTIDRPLPGVSGSDALDIQALLKDRTGDLWVSIVRMGLFRRHGNAWSKYEAIPFGPAVTMANDTAGRIWLAYPRNRMVVLEAGHILDLSIGHGLSVGIPMALEPAPGGAMWVGGDHGLQRFDGQRFVSFPTAADREFKSISGIKQLANGDLWMNTNAGAVRIPALQIRQLLEHATTHITYELLDHLDGMPGIPNPLRPLPTLVAGNDGRLWFATENGVVWTDPASRLHNSVAPTVVIESLLADGNSLEPTPALELATNTRNLQINYTALSLSIPERVRFRYRLEGRDTQWQEVGSRRAAYYTDLKPGHYVFRVIACNDDGVWNEAGASLGFQLPPALYQTVWFGLLSIAVLGCLFVLLFFLRLRQIKATLRGRLEQRLEARLEERTRIARDLHDSLLQGFQGMMFHLQAVRRLLPHKPEEAAVNLDAAMDKGDDAIAEGREAVQELRRSNPADSDLTDALVALGDELAPLSGGLEAPTYRVVVEGKPMELDLNVRDETYRIVREAVRNAFGHARARAIETEIAFGEASFCVRVRDDGIGLDPDILNRGRREGHWGLPGMHERAASFGGELSIWSDQGAGTEIELRIAAKIAYRGRT